MNRREKGRGGHRGIDTQILKKDKENRKLQVQLKAEKEKLDTTIIKYQKDLNDMQAVSVPTRPKIPSECIQENICLGKAVAS